MVWESHLAGCGEQGCCCTPTYSQTASGVCGDGGMQPGPQHLEEAPEALPHCTREHVSMATGDTEALSTWWRV